METNKIMKKQYLITREQLDRVVDTYLTDKMRGGRVVTNNHKYSKSSLVNAFTNPAGEVLFILFEWSESWDDDEGPRNVLNIDEGLVKFFMRHLGIRFHKAVDIISDWFQETYDYDFESIDVTDNLSSTEAV
tara:strand:- start:15526 stop:15921 length:396 start_codon:yes stop_codon:yes gene_type:complete